MAWGNLVDGNVLYGADLDELDIYVGEAMFMASLALLDAGEYGQVDNYSYSLLTATTDINLTNTADGILAVDSASVTDGLLLFKYRVFLGELYDDYNSSVDTAKWEEDGTESETTTYIKVEGASKYLRTHTSTGLDLKQAAGWSEVAFKCSGAWTTGNGTTSGARNITVFLTDGSSDVSMGSFPMNTGTRGSGSLTAGYMVIKIDQANEGAYVSQAQAGTVNVTGGSDWGSAIDISSLSKYCLKWTTPTQGTYVTVYNVVYAEASDFSGGSALVFETNDLSPGATVTGVVPLVQIEDSTGFTFTHKIKANNTFETAANKNMTQLSDTGTKLYYQVTCSNADSDRLVKIGRLAFKFNI